MRKRDLKLIRAYLPLIPLVLGLGVCTVIWVFGVLREVAAIRRSVDRLAAAPATKRALRDIRRQRGREARRQARETARALEKKK